MRFLSLIIGFIVVALFIVLFVNGTVSVYAQNITPSIWQIRSFDTMKTSRDNARDELVNPQYDLEIQKELTAVKNTGANYVTVDTPYDDEFLPYFRRWVSLARSTGLHVWFRGNWSNWEGWFGYPKNMTPDEHLQKNTDFITQHSDLFQNGDIFDPCPECENAGFWPQPDKNQDYLMFLQTQAVDTQQAFANTGKNVYTNIESVIGGRAKDMFDQKTVDALNHVVSIDHYFNNPQSIADYVTYFSTTFNAKVVVRYFGAPVQDFNGNMTESQQADFIQSVYNILYQQHSSVLGVNYYVIKGGTTSLLRDDGTSKPALQVVTNFFSPDIISGNVTDKLGDPLDSVTVETQDGITISKTDQQGSFTFAIPRAKSVSLVAEKDGYKTVTKNISLSPGKTTFSTKIILTPVNPNLIYKVRLFLLDHKL